MSAPHLVAARDIPARTDPVRRLAGRDDNAVADCPDCGEEMFPLAHPEGRVRVKAFPVGTLGLGDNQANLCRVCWVVWPVEAR